jgi:hypothetical protein
MDRGLLEGYLKRGLSLEQIGALEGRHPSTVGYWVEKHGLTANGRAKFSPRGGLTREQLEPLVNAGLTLEEIAHAVDRSVPTVRYWLARYGLRTKNRRGRRPAHDRAVIDGALAAGKRTVGLACATHGETDFIIENSGRVRCKLCRQERVSEWRRRAKGRLVKEAGGACQICGYDRCQAALEFHHLEPAKKSFALSLRGVTRSMAELRREAAKCILLCATCHAEVEAGVTALPVKLFGARRS